MRKLSGTSTWVRSANHVIGPEGSAEGPAGGTCQARTAKATSSDSSDQMVTAPWRFGRGVVIQRWTAIPATISASAPPETL